MERKNFVLQIIERENYKKQHFTVKHLCYAAYYNIPMDKSSHSMFY